MRRLSAVVALAVLCAACPKLTSQSLILCPKGSVPCGNGCMPPTSVCCDSGDQKTSSFCTNAAGGGCHANPNGNGIACHRQNPFASDLAEFCCAPNADMGSNDCPAGQHHCGLDCQPLDKPCCADGASYEECPTASYVCEMGMVSCGICRTNGGNCPMCPAGSCCQGDPCGDHKCIASTVCTGATTGPTSKENTASSDSSGGCGSGSGSGVACGGGTCATGEFCVANRGCIKNVMSSGCECSPPAPDVCVAAARLPVSQCGTCGPDYNACCPGTMCVNGHCQTSCP